MAVIKSADLVSFVADAKNAGWGYVYSAQGQLYTRELAVAWGTANRAGKSYDYFVNKCSRWFGTYVADCSGLVIEAFRSQIPGYGDKTANTLYNRCVQKGKLSTIPEKPGLCVWRSGHIGIYIGDNNVIEAGGTNIGVVLSKLYTPATSKPWTNWGKLADVVYTDTEIPPEPAPPAFWLGRNLKLTYPYMRGDDIKGVQKAVAAAGYTPGKIDGVYGPKTENAIIRFQKFADIEVDGIVGPETTAALGGTWVTDTDGGPTNPENEQPLGSFEVGRLLKLTTPYMRGDDVSSVQDALKYKGYSPGATDGIYGQKTRNTVYLFQKNKKLTVDGIVGPETTKALGGLWRDN